jgi:hypothetical protein
LGDSLAVTTDSAVVALSEVVDKGSNRLVEEVLVFDAGSGSFAFFGGEKECFPSTSVNSPTSVVVVSFTVGRVV